MIAVIFERWPDTAQEATYFDLAARLRSDHAGSVFVVFILARRSSRAGLA
jgi:hypothetical protein